MTYRFDTGAHSVYSLTYHIIWCVKYRRSVISIEVGDRLKQILTDVIGGYQIEAIETDLDHVHMIGPLINCPRRGLQGDLFSTVVDGVPLVEKKTLARTSLESKLLRCHGWRRTH